MPASGATSFTSVTTVSPPIKCRRRSVSCRHSRSPPPASWPVMRKVIVTGGSRGLGLGIVRRLVCEGYCAIAVARQMSDQLASTIAPAERSRPGSLDFAPFDLEEVGRSPAFVKQLRKEFGPIYGLVNSAAVGTDGALAIMHNS